MTVDGPDVDVDGRGQTTADNKRERKIFMPPLSSLAARECSRASTSHVCSRPTRIYLQPKIPTERREINDD